MTKATMKMNLSGLLACSPLNPVVSTEPLPAMMDSQFQQARVDPRKQALLEARFVAGPKVREAVRVVCTR